MKPLSVFFAVCLFALLCGGCVLKYEDVNKEPEYSPLVNTSYSLSTNMLIYGVNLPPGYGKDINVYMIFPTSSGMKGPEIITKEFLNSGVTLRVQGVRKSINHLPGYQLIEAVVELDPYEKTAKVPVVIELKYLQSTNYVKRLE